MSTASFYYVPIEDRDFMESKIRDNPTLNTHLHILYQMSSQWMYNFLIFQKKTDSGFWIEMMRKTLQSVFEEKIMILKEYPKDTRVKLRDDWKNIYECMTEKHILPTKLIFQSFSYWNAIFCKTNRAVYELFAEMVNCYNHMNSYHEPQDSKWKPYYRKDTQMLKMEKEGEYFVMLLEYFIILLNISIENEEKDHTDYLNGGNYILHVLDAVMYFKDQDIQTVEELVNHIYEFPMKEIFKKEGFIYEPSDFKRHYEELSLRSRHILNQLNGYYDHSITFDHIKEWMTLSREMVLIQQMHFTHYISDGWIQQLHTIVKSIYEKKRVTHIDYQLIYYRIQMIQLFISRVHFI
jgi:hypothetical protein